MRPNPLRSVTLLLVLVVALAVAGCGDEERPAASGSDAGSLSHVDGVVVLEDGQLRLTPADGGGEDLAFELGSEVERGQLRALEASGAPARVTYRPGEEPLLAVAVGSAPAVDDGVEAYEGQVVSVDAKQLVVDGPDGERTFDVSEAEAGAFDVPHLRDHADSREPIRVYVDPQAPDVGIAYEDA